MRLSNTSDGRARSGRSTIIDKEYSDYQKLAEAIGLPLDDGHPTGGFSRERDWFYRSRGRDVAPGGLWLVTLAFADTADATSLSPDPQAPESGWLIAYEIASSAKTGRAILLAGPWNLYTDKVLYAECPLADPDLDDLVSWLRERGM